MTPFKLIISFVIFSLLFIGGCTVKRPQRYGMIIGIKKEKIDYYKKLHKNPWKGVLDQIDRSHIRNFSIWLVEYKKDEFLLFGYFEYDGDNFEKDMEAMAKDPETIRWWKETDPCQIPIPTAKTGEHWVMMEEVFYHDKDYPDARLMPKPKRIQREK